MNQISIKPCSISDFPKILPLLEAYSDVFDYQAKRQIISKGSKILEEEPKHPTLYTAWEGSTLIGFIGFVRDEENPQQLELFGQCIKRGYQGQGVGTALVTSTITQLKQFGAKQIKLKLKSHFPPKVRHFYHHLGFKPFFDETYTGASVEDQALVKMLT